MSSILATIGSNIKFYRKKLGLSQEQLADLANLHRTYVGAVERGERNISAVNIEKIATVLDIETASLLKPKIDISIPNGEIKKELQACSPIPIGADFFNPQCDLPYGLKINHIHQAMSDFIDFIAFINGQLRIKNMSRLESFLMPANFSSIVGEFMNMSIPKYCSDLVKNQYHNGHPDLIPANTFPGNAVQHSDRGLEIKGSRHLSGWQGHNPESVWLMVFCFDSNTSSDQIKNIEPRSFVFRAVYAAKLEEEDWNFSGRSETSRRTITASVNKKGLSKMKANWIYEDSSKL